VKSRSKYFFAKGVFAVGKAHKLSENWLLWSFSFVVFASQITNNLSRIKKYDTLSG